MSEPDNRKPDTKQEGDDDDSHLHQPAQPRSFVESTHGSLEVNDRGAVLLQDFYNHSINNKKPRRRPYFGLRSIRLAGKLRDHGEERHIQRDDDTAHRDAQ